MSKYYLDKIKLENYRCFEKTSLKFKDLCIIVGKNNAGKSTLIEALRLISAAGKKSAKVSFYTVPAGLGFSPFYKGVKLDPEKLKIDLRGVIHFYRDEVAIITAFFNDRTQMQIRLTKEIAFACLFNENNENIKSRRESNKYHFDSISILPQIGLIKENEKLLSSDTVKADTETYLSSRHFRNELWLNRKGKFDSFIATAMETWEGFRVPNSALSYNPSESEFIQFLVQDAGFPGEIGLMGSGIQMWLQIIWFLCKAEESTTVILDEPDVYMHPDLQLKLLRLVKNRFPQVIIATHSIEIISDVEPNNIVLVDKDLRNIRYANDSNAVQAIIDSIGGVQNLSLMRIGNAKKCIFVEGKDITYLSKFFRQFKPESIQSITDLPYVELKGKSNLPQAYGASDLFYTESNGTIKCICILDGDYQSEESKAQMIETAKSHHLHLHIWNQKEIENYLLNPTILYRIAKKKNPDLLYSSFEQKLSELLDTAYNDVLDAISSSKRAESDNKYEVSTCNRFARDYLHKHWTSLERKIALVKGKSLLAKTIQLLREEYGVKTSADKIISEFTAEDIDSELRDVLVMFDL